jgi:hypothetical protein
MNADFYGRALRRIRFLTVVVALAGTVATFIWLGARAAAGFLVGGALSTLNFQGLSMLAGALSGWAKPAPVAAVVIGLRYLLIGCAAYVIVKVLSITPFSVLCGFLAAFAAVILEILYELIFRLHE